MTSRSPAEAGIIDEESRLAAEVPVLAELLQAAGYSTGAVVSHTYCDASRGFARGFDEFDQSAIGGPEEASSPGVLRAALGLLDRLERKPFFLWAHFFDPHGWFMEHPGFTFATSDEHDAASRVQSGVRTRDLRSWHRNGGLTADDLRRLTDIYDSEVRFTDHHIGLLLAELRRRGAYDNTLVIITADHGESLLEHGLLGHSVSLHNVVVGVPLIVKLPSTTPVPGATREVAGPVRLLDLPPTVLTIAGIPAGPGMVGTPLPPVGAPADHPIVVEGTLGFHGSAVVAGNRKLIHDLRHDRLALFDLSVDPGEEHDLWDAGGRTAADEALGALATARSAHLEEVRARPRQAGPELSPDEQERLRALGYLAPDDDG